MHPNDGRAVSNFIVQALQGRAYHHLWQWRADPLICYLDDLIEAFVRMMDTPDEIIGPMNLGNSGEFTIRELAETIIEMTGSRAKLEFKQLPSDDPLQRCPDIRLAARY